MTHIVLEDAGWEWADPLYVVEWADPLYVVEDEPENSPDLGILERYGNPYTVAILVVAALLAAICGVIAWRMR